MLYADQGTEVKKGQKLAGWDPYTIPIITEKDGIAHYVDLTEGVSMREAVDEATGITRKVVVDWKQQPRGSDLKPRITLRDEKGNVITLPNGLEARYFMSVDAILSVENGAHVKAGDVLFIDSSHVLKAQSDLVHIFNHILPSVPAGVYLHFHDIFLPYDYPADILFEWRYSWNEQYALEALLCNSSDYEIILPGYWLWHEHREKIRSLLPSGERRAASIWSRDPPLAGGRSAGGRPAAGDVASNRQASYRYELLDKVEDGEVITITRRGKAVARLVPARSEEGAAQVRQVVEDIKRNRVSRGKPAGPGTTIAELIKAGRRY